MSSKRHHLRVERVMPEKNNRAKTFGIISCPAVHTLIDDGLLRDNTALLDSAASSPCLADYCST